MGSGETEDQPAAELVAEWRATTGITGPFVMDPRVAFYLEHQDAMDAWLRVRDELTPIAHRFLTEVALAAAEQSPSLQDSPQAHLELDCDYPKALYYLPGWRGAGTKPARAAIGFEWMRHNATFGSAQSGVWVDCRHPEGSVLSARLERLFCDAVATSGYARANRWFPAAKIERPQRRDYWNDLGAVKSDILESVSHAWQVFSPLISRALKPR